MIEPLDPAAAPIAALIAAHAPADAAEEAAQREIAALLAAHDAPWRRDRFAPGHLTASAIVVDPARERALLVYHHKLQRWLQPGGHFEAHERDPAAVAAREVLEETHLAARWPEASAPTLLDVDVHVIPARKADPAHRHFDLRFLLVADHDQARAGDGTEAVRWIPLPLDRDLDLDPSLRRALLKLG